ncbi:hypothetical protein BT93_A1891 [Corymbia citriodora subsp. variegata]|nr:hypothetical protein BT93_A1891 [Corymbia citriodora subsp. variegata]
MADSETTVSPSPEEPPSVSRSDSDPGEAPRILALPEEPGKDEREDGRETKRRRNCPKALDKVQELGRPDRHHQHHHSFTFDTKFNACSPESTPKFGSFNFCGQIREETDRTRGDEERQDEGEEQEQKEDEEEEEEEEEADEEDSSDLPVINGIGKPLEGE